MHQRFYDLATTQWLIIYIRLLSFQTILLLKWVQWVPLHRDLGEKLTFQVSKEFISNFFGQKLFKKSLPKYHFKLNFQVIPLQFFLQRSHSGTYFSPSFSTCEALSPAPSLEAWRCSWVEWWSLRNGTPHLKFLVMWGWTIPSFFWWLTYVFLMFFNIMQQTLLFSMTVHKYSMTRP